MTIAYIYICIYIYLIEYCLFPFLRAGYFKKYGQRKKPGSPTVLLAQCFLDLAVYKLFP